MKVAREALAELKDQCETGGSTDEQRQAERKEIVARLKEALEILRTEGEKV